MDAIRLSFRKQLLDKYAPELNKVQRQLSALVAQLSKKYGVKIRTH
jgi:hypothetical protein